MRLFAAVLIVLAASAPLGAQSPPKIPLVEGLTIVSAVVNIRSGDYESFKIVHQIDEQGVHLRFSAPRVKVPVQRIVRPQDLESSRFFLLRFIDNYPIIVENSTGLGASKLTLTELKAGKSSVFSCCMLAPFDQAGSLSGTLTRVGTAPVPVAVIVNDVRIMLPTVVARGTLGGQESEFHFLDDFDNPMVLKWRVGRQRLDVIKISFPAQQIAASLAATGRADVYGIYFDVGSATLRPESEPVLKDIADALNKNAAWKLSVEGHTDSVGGAEPNLDLSRRRAASVKEALVSRYKIGGDRLVTTGHGASRPKETNSTLEGRARNRRVELVRQ